MGMDHDRYIPSVVYYMTYRMTDQDYNDYRRALAVFPFAGAVEKMLAVGEGEFDKVSQHRPGCPFCEGEELEDLLRELVLRENLGLQYDLARPGPPTPLLEY